MANCTAVHKIPRIHAASPVWIAVSLLKIMDFKQIKMICTAVQKLEESN